VTTNSSVNFIIYCIFGEKFKRIFLRSMFELLGRDDYSLPGEIIRYPNNSSASHQATTASLSRHQSILLHNRLVAGAGAENAAGSPANLPPAAGGARGMRNGQPTLYVDSCCELARRESAESYVLCGALRSCANLPRICVNKRVFLMRAAGRSGADNKADDNYN
jgi:hypothetical protein